MKVLRVCPEFIGNKTYLDIEKVQLQGRRHRFIEFQEKVTGFPELKGGSIDFFFNVLKCKGWVAHKKYNLHTDSHQSLVNLDVILLAGILVEVFLEYQFEEWEDDILPDLLSFPIEIFLPFLVNDLNMLHDFSFERSVHYLSLIQQFLKFAVLFINIVKHLHSHSYGGLADQLNFHRWGWSQHRFGEFAYVDALVHRLCRDLLFVNQLIVENSVATEVFFQVVIVLVKFSSFVGVTLTSKGGKFGRSEICQSFSEKNSFIKIVWPQRLFIEFIQPSVVLR